MVPEKLAGTIRWSKPRTIFVNSMSDLFHDGVPWEFIDRVRDVMRFPDWHTYQVLTKRAERMSNFLSWRDELPHVWWGVSVENRRHGLPRIDYLRNANAPATIRFLSVEPLLEDLGKLDLSGTNWVIVGGESGPGARPMEADWVRSIRDQCTEQGVLFFFKQWGGVRKKEAGRLLDGRTHDEMPARTTFPVKPADERSRLAELFA